MIILARKIKRDCQKFEASSLVSALDSVKLLLVIRSVVYDYSISIFNAEREETYRYM